MKFAPLLLGICQDTEADDQSSQALADRQAPSEGKGMAPCKQEHPRSSSVRLCHQGAKSGSDIVSCVMVRPCQNATTILPKSFRPTLGAPATFSNSATKTSISTIASFKCTHKISFPKISGSRLLHWPELPSFAGATSLKVLWMQAGSLCVFSGSLPASITATVTAAHGDRTHSLVQGSLVE